MIFSYKKTIWLLISHPISMYSAVVISRFYFSLDFHRACLSCLASTLQAWMTVDGVDLRAIGIFSLVGLPYTLKFLWSPIMDRFVPPLLGRRRGWIVLTQIVIMLGIIAMSLNSPRNALWLMGALALFVAFTSAS